MSACNNAFCYDRTRTKTSTRFRLTLSKTILMTPLSKTAVLIGISINFSESFSNFSTVILFITPTTLTTTEAVQALSTHVRGHRDVTIGGLT